jgi:hypothetical protein
MQPSWSRIVIVTAAAAVAVAATATARTSPASATRARASAQVVDKTYSCRVWRQHPFYFGTQVRLPATASGGAQPGLASVTTAHNHAFQVVFKDVKNSLRVDTSICRPSSRRVPLKPAGLSLYQTVTPHFVGHLNGNCPTHVKRVLVHLRVTMTNGTPERALFAVRKGDAKGRPLAFFRWSPDKITGYLAKSCTAY